MSVLHLLSKKPFTAWSISLITLFTLKHEMAAINEIMAYIHTCVEIDYLLATIFDVFKSDLPGPHYYMSNQP